MQMPLIGTALWKKASGQISAKMFRDVAESTEKKVYCFDFVGLQRKRYFGFVGLPRKRYIDFVGLR